MIDQEQVLPDGISLERYAVLTPERIRLALRLLKASENGAGFWSDPVRGIATNGGITVGKRRIGTWYSNYTLDGALKAAGYL